MFRLAELIDINQCHTLVIKLGFSQPAWSDITIVHKDEPLVTRFLALCNWKDSRSESSFQELYDALPEDCSTHVLCQVGNYCSHI